MGFNPYRWLWTRIGGRPWTFARRDFWHKYEIINIVFFVSVGFFSGIYFPIIWLWVTSDPWHLVQLVTVFYFLGVLQGHFWWGTKYIPDQQGD